MKKILIGILAFLYLSTSVGATIHFHYCMGKLVAWGLTDNGSEDCTLCGMPKQHAREGCVIAMKGCCHDEQKQIKNEKDQKPSQVFPALVQPSPAVVILLHNIWQDKFINSDIAGQPPINGPPVSYTVPFFLRNCNFRI